MSTIPVGLCGILFQRDRRFWVQLSSMLTCVRGMVRRIRVCSSLFRLCLATSYINLLIPCSMQGNMHHHVLAERRASGNNSVLFHRLEPVDKVEEMGRDLVFECITAALTGLGQEDSSGASEEESQRSLTSTVPVAATTTDQQHSETVVGGESRVLEEATAPAPGAEVVSFSASQLRHAALLSSGSDPGFQVSYLARQAGNSDNDLVQLRSLVISLCRRESDRFFAGIDVAGRMEGINRMSSMARSLGLEGCAPRHLFVADFVDSIKFAEKAKERRGRRARDVQQQSSSSTGPAVRGELPLSDDERFSSIDLQFYTRDEKLRMEAEEDLWSGMTLFQETQVARALFGGLTERSDDPMTLERMARFECYLLWIVRSSSAPTCRPGQELSDQFDFLFTTYSTSALVIGRLLKVFSAAAFAQMHCWIWLPEVAALRSVRDFLSRRRQFVCGNSRTSSSCWYFQSVELFSAHPRQSLTALAATGLEPWMPIGCECTLPNGGACLFPCSRYCRREYRSFESFHAYMYTALLITLWMFV